MIRGHFLPVWAALLLHAPAGAEDQAVKQTGTTTASTETAQCTVPSSAAIAVLLSKDIESFDQAPGASWRYYGETQNCPEIAAMLIETYLAAHPNLLARDRTLLAFHAGQMRAYAGQTGVALQHFRGSFRAGLPFVSRMADAPDEAALRTLVLADSYWDAYARATIAFLEPDFEALRSQRDVLATLPLISFSSPAGQAVDPRLARLNLDVVTRLLACFGRSYREAYDTNSCSVSSAGSTVSNNQSDVPGCKPDVKATACLVPAGPDVSEVLRRLGPERSAAWADGGLFSLAYQGQADRITVCCTLEVPLRRVGNTDLWVLSARIERLPQAVIEYVFNVTNGNRTTSTSPRQWAGDQALRAKRAGILKGAIQSFEVPSTALREARQVNVYTPPGFGGRLRYPVVYMTDGTSVEILAKSLEPAVAAGKVKPVVLVGAYNGNPRKPTPEYELARLENPSADLRVQEYLEPPSSSAVTDGRPWLGRERFAAHEIFFMEELPRWAQSRFNVSPRREDVSLFGYSNGAAFVVAMAKRHPRQFGHAVAFSFGFPPAAEGIEQVDGLPRFTLAAGTLETTFHRQTHGLAERLRRAKQRVVFRDYVRGHSLSLWEDAFPEAIADAQAK